MKLIKEKSEHTQEKVKGEYASQVATLNERLSSKTQEIETAQQFLKEKEDQLREKESLLTSTIADKKSLETELSLSRKNADEKLKTLLEAKEQMKQEFQNLAQSVMEDKSKKFTEQNKVQMEMILNPLKEKITTFEKKVSDTYDKDSKERLTLQKEIENLRELNKHISEDANNLAQALKGQSKVQGTWGEIVLERVLEMSGLRKGQEYDVQEGYRNEDGKLYKPDVIVHLPEEKNVVIDSKMSLTAYERYYSSESDDDRTQHLKEHITSIRNHINELSGKNYDELKGVKSLNYVLMFIPVESAFLLAFEQDPDLYRIAFDKNIIIVSPSTLLATLRTIQNIWQYEYQNRNAQKIADDAGKLYDKFVAFVEELEKIGNRIKQAQDTYDGAMKHLSTGRGNLVKRAEDLKTLGIKNKKALPNSVVEANIEIEET
ncbi:MAG: DNA recombination protein RmuC [SAR324 cluster bacterium]|nr:DNA recombination protein RmuC [SAR324 cluster bacterium]